MAYLLVKVQAFKEHLSLDCVQIIPQYIENVEDIFLYKLHFVYMHN